jgi:glycosyltransferase involved in cell wall biosynthesis
MTIKNDAIWVIIPAYNEARMIDKVVDEVKRLFPNVLVIDDCSNDHTARNARSAGARVLRHPINLGQGASLQTGFEYALAAGASHIVTFDADGQHHIEDVPRMLEALAESGADLALGSRFLGTTVGMTEGRRRLLQAATYFTKLTTGLSLSDCHNGLRVLTAKAVRALNLRQNRMAHASEILSGIRQHHLSYVEVPVTISYTQYSRQKGQTFSDAFVIFRDLIAVKLAS